MKILKAIAVGLMLATPVGVAAQDCDDVLDKYPLDYDSRYDGYSGEEVGRDFGIRLQDPNDLEAQVFIMFVVAKQGNVHGQYNMGVFLREGMGVSKDPRAAVCWFRLAANQGDVDAQFNLASMYYGGRGLPKDITKAHMWAVIAASLEDQGAKELMMQIQGYMGFNQMAEGWDRARVCMASNYQDCD